MPFTQKVPTVEGWVCLVWIRMTKLSLWTVGVKENVEKVKNYKIMYNQHG